MTMVRWLVLHLFAFLAFTGTSSPENDPSNTVLSQLQISFAVEEL